MSPAKRSFALGVLALIGAACRPARPADLVLRSVAVYTMAAPDTAEAVAIRAGRIVYVGDNAGADKLIGDSTEVLDLAGRMVLPSFRDTHVHPQSGVELGECQLGTLPTAAAILDSVQRCVANTPRGSWVRGHGWQLPVFPDANPHKQLLDSIAPDHPVVLVAADGHSAWVNSRALAVAGIDRHTADPAGGRIERGPSGDPSGTLRESAADLVARQLPKRTEAELREGIRRALAIANGYGITAVHDASVGPDALAVYAALDRDGELTARVVAAQRVDPDGHLGQVDSLAARRKRFAGTRYFRADAAKLFADGVIEAGTAALLEPYTNSASRGDANFRDGQLDSLVAALDRARIQIHIHAIGDRAVRRSLDAIERARGSRKTLSQPPILAHIQLIDSADISRFASLGVVAAFQPLWAYADEYITQLTEPVLGPERSRWLYPIASVARTGAVVAAGSDWSVSSLNPLEAIQVALTRRPLGASTDSAWLPTERVDLTTMLRAYTINGARAAGEEERTGSLEVGKAADLIVVDRNLYRVPAAEIHQARILLTLLDGQSVYRHRALR
ncbi:MAG: amidohydrolase [Gemmatimonadales bacterium]